MNRISIKTGEKGRIAFVRILPQSDLIPSIEEAFSKSAFETAQISVAIGSLESASYTYITQNKKYHTPIRRNGPFELLGASGFISNTNGKVEIHIHGIMADENGILFGGHLLEKGNIICATCELTLIELKGISIQKMFDKETGFTLFKVKS